MLEGISLIQHLMTYDLRGSTQKWTHLDNSGYNQIQSEKKWKGIKFDLSTRWNVLLVQSKSGHNWIKVDITQTENWPFDSAECLPGSIQVAQDQALSLRLLSFFYRSCQGFCNWVASLSKTLIDSSCQGMLADLWVQASCFCWVSPSCGKDLIAEGHCVQGACCCWSRHIE